MTRELEKAIAFFVRKRERYRARPDPELNATPDRSSFRATVDLRLSNLERQLDELRTRINGLLFLLAGAVATQIVLRLFG